MRNFVKNVERSETSEKALTRQRKPPPFAQKPSDPSLSRRKWLNSIAIGAAIIAVASLFLPLLQSTQNHKAVAADQVATMDELKDLNISSLTEASLARVNLICGQGMADLPRNNAPNATSAVLHIDLNTSLEILDKLSQKARVQTSAALPEFRADPQAYGNSEPFFRLSMLDQVLFPSHQHADSFNQPAVPIAQSGGPGFNPPPQGEMPTNHGRVSYRYPESIFISGILDRGRSATAVNLPFMYAVIGRQLGYPLKLALARGHVFLRWQGGPGKETFDVEITAEGLRQTTDAEYQHWPMTLNASQIAASGYLRSLTPSEEAALCVLLRSACLGESGRPTESEQMRSLARQWTSSQAVLDQMDEIIPDSSGQKLSRFRLGELADRRLAAEEMSLQARAQQNQRNPNDLFGRMGMPQGMPGVISPGARPPSPHPTSPYAPRDPRPPTLQGTTPRRPGSS